VEELATLRGAQLVKDTSQAVAVGRVEPLAAAGGGIVAGQLLDLELEVRFPTEATGGVATPTGIPLGRLVLSVFGAADGSEETRVVVQTDYNSGWATLMPNTDLPCDAADVNKHNGTWCDENCSKGIATPAACEAVCNANINCVGFAYLGLQSLCCQKRWVGEKVASAGNTAGIKPGLIPTKFGSALVVERNDSSKVPLIETGPG
jgi:hypothetical protein